MEPFPPPAAVEWEFRCHGREVPAHRWDWRCRSSDGAVVAKSQGFFRSLREAVADASANGFQADALSRGSPAKRGTGATKARTGRG